jgi:heptosyltransferase-2
MEVALIGSPAEAEVTKQVLVLSQAQPIVLTGKTTVAQAVAMISVADVLVTNDTGPAHIGAAIGTSTLVIFGPTNPLTTYPMSPTAEMIREPSDCAPCMLRDCPIDHRCMTAISVEAVFQRSIAMMPRLNTQVSG